MSRQHTTQGVRWHRPRGHWCSASSGKPHVATHGGSSRCWFFWVSPLSSSTRRGRPFRAIISSTVRTCRRSIRRSCSATARTRGSGRNPSWWPAAIPFSAALLILWAPGGFRFTCYYYRGAYYKAFWADPPACTVGEPRKSLSRRAIVSARPAERPPLFSVSRHSSSSAF